MVLMHRLLYVYTPQLLLVLCTYPQRDGQAELTWVDDYILRWFTCPYPSINWAQY